MSPELKGMTNIVWYGMPCSGIVNDAATGSRTCCLYMGSLASGMATMAPCSFGLKTKPVMAPPFRPVHVPKPSGSGPAQIPSGTGYRLLKTSVMN